MKRLTAIILIIAATVAAEAQNWCETLIESLNSHSNIDKTVVVNRSPQTHQITSATYDYRFTSEELYKKIAKTMTEKTHVQQSDFYSEIGGKEPTIILRFTDGGRRWSCKLQSDRHNKQFLVSVKTDEGATVTHVIELVPEKEQVKRSKRHTKTKATENNTGNTQSLREHEAALRQAEAERRKKLGR